MWRGSRLELSRRLRRPAKDRLQPYNHTLPDRYPWLFDFAAAALETVPSPRLLSFGCSRGDEVFRLRQRLPTAAIRGVDMDPRNIATCRARLRPLDDPRISFEVGSSARGEPCDHYDAIFCLGALRHGDLAAKRAARGEPLFSFEDFERTVLDLARCLKPGGLLLLHTTEFRFSDTVAAPAFDVVLEARPARMAPDLLFDRDGWLLPDERYDAVGFRKRLGTG